MSLSGGNPKGGSKTLGNSLQMAYQRDESTVGADKQCRLDNNIPIYFIQAGFGMCMGQSGPGSTSLTCREIQTKNGMAPGTYANCT